MNLRILAPFKLGRTPMHGTWKGVMRDGVRTVNVMCSGCGFAATLEPSDHAIDDRGKVLPSVVCPRCDQHDYLTLAGWDNVVRLPSKEGKPL